MSTRLVEAPVAPEKTDDFDIDKLSHAVAYTETHGCTKGYGLIYNNCHGIKNGNTAPCPKIGRSNMCIYDHPDQSHAAFKTIWKKWYKTYPNIRLASIWSGNDNPGGWLAGVDYYYQNN